MELTKKMSILMNSEAKTLGRLKRAAHYVKNSRVTALARFPHSAKGEDRVLP
jgi:hypothetical protein